MFFVSLFVAQHMTTSRAKEASQTPTTPGQVSKGDTFDSGTSFLQFYKKKAKKTKVSIPSLVKFTA